MVHDLIKIAHIHTQYIQPPVFNRRFLSAMHLVDVVGDQTPLLDELDRYFDVIRRGVYKDES
jgi:hypothetical protein